MLDPIADMLTRIRNAQMAGNSTTRMPYSKVKARIAEILAAEGYLSGMEDVRDAGRVFLQVRLKYVGKKPAIQSIARESTPGHRMYRSAGELPKVLNGYGIAIVSTSQGIMTNKDARRLGIGGEVMCSVY